MPKGQEAEFAGFALFCSQILGWLPPLVFTLMNENPKIGISWGGVHLNIWLFTSFIFYSLMPAWKKCLEITSGENKILNIGNDDNSGDVETNNKANGKTDEKEQNVKTNNITDDEKKNIKSEEIEREGAENYDLVDTFDDTF